VIPAAPHGDKSNPNVALFPGFQPAGSRDRASPPPTPPTIELDV
jgi:hypothetical protein